MYDIVIVGGGLSACLTTYLLKIKNPEIKSLILEATGPHDHHRQTWSFQTLPANSDPSSFGSFTSPEKSWFKDFIDKSWPGYDVKFPSYQKSFSSPYHSIKSDNFHKKMQKALGSSICSYERVVAIEDHRVVTEGGKEFFGQIILDARGWPTQRNVAGFQKFVGLNLKLNKAHGITQPLLMDSCVPQEDGFRFFYLLPWSKTEVLVEDTRYSNKGELDDKTIEEEILRYAGKKGWTIDHIDGLERGSLGLPGFHAEEPSAKDGVLGVRAGFYHPTTGYSFYQAVATAENISRLASKDLKNIPQRLRELAEQTQKDQEFYRRLNNMMFYAAEPSDRYRILERFYEHDADLIARFYAGRTSMKDKMRILSGRPPIPMQKAIKHFFSRQDRPHEVTHA